MAIDFSNKHMKEKLRFMKRSTQFQPQRPYPSLKISCLNILVRKEIEFSWKICDMISLLLVRWIVKLGKICVRQYIYKEKLKIKHEKLKSQLQEVSGIAFPACSSQNRITQSLQNGTSQKDTQLYMMIIFMSIWQSSAQSMENFVEI